MSSYRIGLLVKLKKKHITKKNPLKSCRVVFKITRFFGTKKHLIRKLNIFLYKIFIDYRAD